MMRTTREPAKLSRHGEVRRLKRTANGFVRLVVKPLRANSRYAGIVEWNAISHKPYRKTTASLKSGIAKFNEANYDAALLDINKAIEMNAKNAEAYFYLGEIYLMQNEPKRAMENYNKAIELDSLLSKAYKGRGKLKAKMEDYMGSIDDFNIALKQNKNFSDAYFNRASSYLFLKDYKASIADYTKVIEMNKKDFQAYEQRGTAKFESGDKKGACKDWSKAGELGDFKIYDIIKKNCK